MVFQIDAFDQAFDDRFQIFHELMSHKVNEILLVSTLYDACIIEGDCRFSERIIHEYRGLNLSRPPRVTWVSSAEEALFALGHKKFDMVITMLRLVDMDAFALAAKIKQRAPELPIILLTHCALNPESSLERSMCPGIDRILVWSGNTDIMVATIKNIEDRWNVEHDTRLAGVRVIMLVEDSYTYLSAILPILYKEVVVQTQAVMEQGLNEEHRLLTMRARPKILIAENFEEAAALYEQFKPYLLGVISDARFPRHGKMDEGAGVELLKRIKGEIPDIPLMLTSSEPLNRKQAIGIPARFLDKNSPSLHAEISAFFIEELGFGDFVFRMPDGKEIGRVSNMRSLEMILPTIPNASYYYHCKRNDFSRWLFARSEILLASKLRPSTAEDFAGDIDKMLKTLIAVLRARRSRRQKGVVVNFDAGAFDPDTDFLKIGKGSLGGKARGLAFLSTMLQRRRTVHERFQDVSILVPKTLVLTTSVFDAFIEANDLKNFAKSDAPDIEVAEAFMRAMFPRAIEEDLRVYLRQVRYPLAIRSSGLLEDAQFRAYAGLYSTCMIPNNHPELDRRVEELITAIKRVYASTYFRGPKAFAQRVGLRTAEEKMAVIIQQLVGKRYEDHFYPAISGVAQSHNYYPFANMKPEEGIATIALGLGKTVVGGGKALRFSPKYPHSLPQFSTVDDMLENAQRFFYALKIGDGFAVQGFDEDCTLAKREIIDTKNERPVQLLVSTYVPDEHRIKDSAHTSGYPVLTFAPVLKYGLFPLAEMLVEVLNMVTEGMGCPVEIEFSVNLSAPKEGHSEFALLQIRPMTAREELLEVEISDEEIAGAFCFSQNALGNAWKEDMADILYVKPDVFDPAHTQEIARQLGKMNARLVEEGRKYLLVGPGRWGSADRWLGIPVSWSEISGVGAIVETYFAGMKAEPSQGSHFFHNITTLGIPYLMVTDPKRDFLDWERLTSLEINSQTPFVAHVRLKAPFVLKIDGRRSWCVILAVN